MLKEKYDVVILGGGVSGVFSALKINRDLKILIIEKNKRILQKMLATGNGRCNISNKNVNEKFYNSPAIKNILEKNINFLNDIEEMGIVFTENDGRIYPKSETAAGIVSLLISELEKHKNITVRTDERAVKISGNEVYSDKGVYTFKQLIFALGSNAGSSCKAEEFEKFFKDIKFIPFKPSLVNLKCNTKYLKGLQGQRAKCKVSVKDEKELLFEEKGEIIFKEEGISGIPALQASAYLARGKNIKIALNFVYDISEKKFEKIKEVNKTYSGVFVKNLYQNIDTYARDCNISEYEALSNFELTNIEPGSMKDAQVASGGISLEEIDLERMFLKKKRNMYCIGETVDIDGICGGYNLTWAVISAFVAAKAINKSIGS